MGLRAGHSLVTLLGVIPQQRPVRTPFAPGIQGSPPATMSTILKGRS